MPEATLELLQALVQKVLDEQAATRRENRETRSLVLAVSEQGRRLERRFGDLERRFGDMERRFDELRDEIELMVKAELMGRLGHFETQIEGRLDAIERRLASDSD